MTVRNVRAHQSRGLLPPPEVRGRTGYYGEEHVARIELIRELQADGFNLELIRRLLESAGSSTAALRFTRALRAPYGDEAPEIITAEELAERWGSGDPKLLKRAQELGIMRPLGDGRYEEVSPTLARVRGELAALGISARQALDVAGSLRRHADSVARAYMKLFVEPVCKPFETEGRSEERWVYIAGAHVRSPARAPARPAAPVTDSPIGVSLIHGGCDHLRDLAARQPRLLPLRRQRAAARAHPRHHQLLGQLGAGAARPGGALHDPG